MRRSDSTTVEYRYWSERMCTALANDNDAGGVRVTGGSLNVGLGPVNGAVTLQQPSDAASRAARARELERRLRKDVRQVENLVPGQGPKALTGTSRLVLSSLRSSDGRATGAVILFADIATRTSGRIALCLFGGASNVCDFTPSVPAWRRFGWTSSHIEGVTQLLLSGAHAENASDVQRAWRPGGRPGRDTVRRVCHHAVNICEGQGEFFGRGTLPWRRGYTLGHYEQAEWLARIYYGASDTILAAATGFDAIYVGAAFWVRAPLDSWMVYDQGTIPALEASRYPAPIRPLARRWHSRRHPRGTKENQLATALGTVTPID